LPLQNGVELCDEIKQALRCLRPRQRFVGAPQMGAEVIPHAGRE
jgi:hypothetical protein